LYEPERIPHREGHVGENEADRSAWSSVRRRIVTGERESIPSQKTIWKVKEKSKRAANWCLKMVKKLETKQGAAKRPR